MKKLVLILMTLMLATVSFAQIFESSVTITDRSTITDFKLGDMNGDGRNDIITLNKLGEIKVWLEISSVNLIPVLSSNFSASPIVVSASTTHWNRDLAPWKAFNNDATSWTTGQCLDEITGWVQVDFGSEKHVTSYKVRGRDDNPLYSYKDWTFQGSSDGSSWVTLDTPVSQTEWHVGEKRTFTIPTANYRYYRWNVTSNNKVSLGTSCAQELEIWGY